MAEGDDRKAGNPSKIERLARGIGLHKVSLGTGTYGSEMQSRRRRQGRSERGRIWRENLRIHITNRIAKAASAGRFGNVINEGEGEVSITMGDCVALDSNR